MNGGFRLACAKIAISVSSTRTRVVSHATLFSRSSVFLANAFSSFRGFKGVL